MAQAKNLSVVTVYPTKMMAIQFGLYVLLLIKNFLYCSLLFWCLVAAARIKQKE